MKILAGLLAVLGVILLLVGINMDTSVSTVSSYSGDLYGSSYSLPSRVNNNGLMQKQLMTVLGGLAACLGAVIALGFGLVVDAVRPAGAPRTYAPTFASAVEPTADEVRDSYELGAPVEAVEPPSGKWSLFAAAIGAILVLAIIAVAASLDNRPRGVTNMAMNSTVVTETPMMGKEAGGNMSSAVIATKPTPRRHR